MQQSKNATITIEEGLTIAESSGNKGARILGLCFKARIFAHSERFDEAQECLAKAKDLPADEWLKRRIGTTATLIVKRGPRGNNKNQDVPRSRKELEQQGKQLKENLAKARKLRKNRAFLEARELLRIAEKLEDDIGDLELRAFIRLELGLLELDSKNLIEGEKILKDVCEVFAYLRKNDDVSAINRRLTEEKKNEARK